MDQAPMADSAAVLYTRHAQARAQQRGIPHLIVEWLLEFGARKPSAGADMVYFDKRSREALRRYAGRQALAKLDGLLDVYAVVSNDGQVLTLGHRTKRIRSR